MELGVDEHQSESDDERTSHFSPIRTRLFLGIVGGSLATLVMTAFRMPTSRSLPPTANFWAKFVASGDPEDYPAVGLVLHLLYGVGAGVVFAMVSPGRGEPDALAETKDALLGTAYGVGLSLFGSQVILEGLIGMELQTDERLVFHLSHVIYGLTLGTWVGSRLGND